VGLERGPLSLAIEDLFDGRNSGSGLENREYGRREPSRWPRNTLYAQNWALTSPTSGGLSVGMVLSPTKATELVFGCILNKEMRNYTNCWNLVKKSTARDRLFP
jgi:hypothetical protein